MPRTGPEPTGDRRRARPRRGPRLTHDDATMHGRLNWALGNSLYPPIAVGGAEKVVQSLAEALTRSDHRVSVMTLSQDPVGKVERIDA